MTTRRITTTALGLTLGGLLLAGCGATSPASSANSTGALTTTASTTAASSTSDPGSAVSPGVTLQDTPWGLYRYERRTPTEVLTGNAAVGTEPAIVITDGRITFDAQCNSPSGDVTVDDATLTVSQLMGTELGCDDGRGEMEKLFTDTFVGTVGYTLADDILTVTGADTTLTFVPITGGGGIPAPTPEPMPTAEEGTDMPTDGTTAPATPVDGTWSLTGYTDQTGARPVPDGVQPTIILGAGRIGIDTQCNSVGGNLAVADTTLTVTEVIGTMMFCDGPRGEMETLLTGTLKDTVEYTLSDGVLTVTGPAATLTFAQQIATTPPLVSIPAVAETVPEG